jgi:putative transposase
MPEKDRPIVERIRQVVGTTKKGRKKVIPLVRRIDPALGCSKIRRIYQQYGFALMKRLKRRTRNNPKNPAIVPIAANEEWAIDFMHDSLVDGRSIRAFNIIDPFNRQCKGVYIRHSIAGCRAIKLLDQSIEKYGKPKFIRSDNGPEFISKLFQKWMHNNDIGWLPIQKGKPQQNCFVERFNGTMREEFFNANLFFTVEQAQREALQWLEEYNSQRPHESLKNKTPIEYAA